MTYRPTPSEIKTRTPSRNLPPPPRVPIPAESRRRFRPVFRRAGNRFKVGIIRCGSLTFRDDRWRSTTIERFLKPSDVPAVQIYSLHKGPLEQELETSGAFPVVVGLGGHVRDFADRAAVVDELDLVIMTDTAVAHLAGSLGGLARQTGLESPQFRSLLPVPDDRWYDTLGILL